jgi:hypothetical protein
MRHGLLPLLHCQLEQLSANGSVLSSKVSDDNPEQLVPAHVLAEFRRDFEESAARNFALIVELLGILDRLESEGVRAAVYKGPALAMLAYGNVLLRSFSDLDLLVGQSDLVLVHKVLSTLGYIQQFHSNPSSNEYAHSYVQPQSDDGKSDMGGTVIEVHWSIAPRNYALPPHPPGALERLVSLQIDEHVLWTLSPEDHLLAACWHGYKHRWWRLEWITCVAEIVRKSQSTPGPDAGTSLDWDTLLQRATRSGSKRMLFCGLGLAQWLFDAPLPPMIVEQMALDRGLHPLLNSLQKALLLESSRFEDIRFFHLGSRERFRDKLRYIWRTALLGNTQHRQKKSMSPLGACSADMLSEAK